MEKKNHYLKITKQLYFGSFVLFLIWLVVSIAIYLINQAITFVIAAVVSIYFLCKTCWSYYCSKKKLRLFLDVLAHEDLNDYILIGEALISKTKVIYFDGECKCDTTIESITSVTYTWYHVGGRYSDAYCLVIVMNDTDKALLKFNSKEICIYLVSYLSTVNRKIKVVANLEISEMTFEDLKQSAIDYAGKR